MIAGPEGLAPGARYDRVAYPAKAFPAALPGRLGAIARIHGLDPPEPAEASFLDLGCGDGINALAAAGIHPGIRSAGIDVSTEAIGRGRALRSAAGLDGVALDVGDLSDPDLATRLAPADYVVLHGVLSWVDRDVAESAMELVGRMLTPTGVALVSYNALPGWHLRRLARDLAMRRAPPDMDPDARAAAAVEAIRDARALHGADDEYDSVLALAEARYEEADPAVLHHDDLAPVCEPLGLDAVASLASAHGLRYLDEALPDHWWRWRISAARRDRLVDRVGADRLRLQLEADAASGVAFKASLLVRADARPREPDPQAARDMYVWATPRARDGEDGEAPAVTAFAAAIADAAPRASTVAELAGRTGLEDAVAAPAALRLVAEGRAVIATVPPPAEYEPGARPSASPLARAQAELGAPITTLTGETIEFAEPQGRALLAMLDGTHTRAEIGEAVAAAGAGADSELAGADELVDRFARAALLVSPPPAG